MPSPQLLLEASRDGKTWLPLRSRYKPDDPTRGLKPIPPLHMPRLDWWLWFVALGHRGRWFKGLCQRLLEGGSPEVLRLFDPATNPFPDPARPPVALRVCACEYQWPAPGEDTDAQWVRSDCRLKYGPMTLETSDYHLSAFLS